MGTSSEAASDSTWFLHLGASSHLTGDFTNLNSGTEYIGQEKLQMRNGLCITIQHIGHSFVQSPFDSSIKLDISNVLHSPPKTL